MKCTRCNKNLVVKKLGRPPKYCPSCARKKKQAQDRHRMWKYRNLGTSGFKEHRERDFYKEQRAVEKEKKRIGIK